MRGGASKSRVETVSFYGSAFIRNTSGFSKNFFDCENPEDFRMATHRVSSSISKSNAVITNQRDSELRDKTHLITDELALIHVRVPLHVFHLFRIIYFFEEFIYNLL